MSRTVYVDFKTVKAAVSMSQIIDRYGLTERFKRHGDSLSGPCPLHDGQNPTQFRVSLTKNCWNCFGACQGGGNTLDFVARKEGVTVREAALKISEWFDLPLGEKPEAEDEHEHSHKEKPQPKAKTTRQPDATAPDTGPNKPLGFALQNLDPAHPYLAERGLSAETIAEFGLGHCQKGSMTGRIVVPIHNAEGQLVAYAGRWPGSPPDEDTPKYKLPPGFRKAQEVFNLHRAMREPQDTPLFVVEGFFDCMWLWQHGIRRVVALMGSSLSATQEELVTRATTQHTRAIVMLDEDEAGQTGRLKVLNRLALKMFVQVFRFEHEAQQPDTLTSEQREELRAL
jgi:DNA primase